VASIGTWGKTNSNSAILPDATDDFLAVLVLTGATGADWLWFIKLAAEISGPANASESVDVLSLNEPWRLVAGRQRRGSADAELDLRR
jgi:hypothetical protein